MSTSSNFLAFLLVVFLRRRRPLILPRPCRFSESPSMFSCFAFLFLMLTCFFGVPYADIIFVGVRASYLREEGKPCVKSGRQHSIPFMISSRLIFPTLIRGHGRTRPSNPPLPWPRGAAGRPNRGLCRLQDAVVSGLEAAVVKAQPARRSTKKK